MRQAECADFLKWCLLRLRMRWEGFRRVRLQVCKRIARRTRDLGLEDLAAYRNFLESHGDEWTWLDRLCRVIISRFYRHRAVAETLESDVLPDLASLVHRCGRTRFRAWSCGCASSEEAYTLGVLWNTRLARMNRAVCLEIEATDSDPQMLERARRGLYAESGIRELREDFRLDAFDGVEEPYRVRDGLRQSVIWRWQDVREGAPPGPFDLIPCRNLVLTYFEETLRREVLEKVVAVLRTGGAIVVGSHERLPVLSVEFEQVRPSPPIFRRLA